LSSAEEDVALEVWFCPTEERTARELRELTPREREAVWADLSGNEKTSTYRAPSFDDDSEQEDPVKVEELLRVVQRRIHVMVSRDEHKRSAYESALQLVSPRYVEALHRSFLRMHHPYHQQCSSPDKEKEMAQRLVQHLEELHRLFRGCGMVRDLHLSDPELYKRSGRLVEKPDKVGRRVLFTQLDGLFRKETRSVVS
jgi:hypothetical protein